MHVEVQAGGSFAVPDWQDAYPAVVKALAPEYRGLREDQVESVLRETFGEGFGLADAEGFFDDLGHTLSRAGQTVAPVLQRALPGVVSGAMSGAALGPYGMIGGALLGGVGSALGSGGGARPPAAPAAPGAPSPLGALAAVPGGAAGPTGAVAQLLAVLGSPTVQQALSSMLLGTAGARSVSTPAGGQLPVAAITSLLGMLAHRASAEWEAVVPTPEADGFGEGLDLASPETRSAWVLGQLVPVEATRDDGEASADEAWIDELYDELEVELLAGPEAYDEAATDVESYPEWGAAPAWRLGSYG